MLKLFDALLLNILKESREVAHVRLQALWHSRICFHEGLACAKLVYALSEGGNLGDNEIVGSLRVNRNTDLAYTEEACKKSKNSPVLGWTHHGDLSKWLMPVDTFASSLGYKYVNTSASFSSFCESLL